MQTLQAVRPMLDTRLDMCLNRTMHGFGMLVGVLDVLLLGIQQKHPATHERKAFVQFLALTSGHDQHHMGTRQMGGQHLARPVCAEIDTLRTSKNLYRMIGRLTHHGIQTRRADLNTGQSCLQQGCSVRTSANVADTKHEQVHSRAAR